MSNLFTEYELLARSELFDPTFYVGRYPAAGAANQDPLMHYVERGGRERLNPSAGFDTEHYLRQCGEFAEVPANPLYHYLTVGVTRGMTPSPNSNLFSLDLPKVVNGRVEVPLRGGLSLVGWAIAGQGVQAVNVAIDGKRVANAHHGLRRPDVAAAHSSRDGALLSGFAAHLPPKVLPPGSHRVNLSLLSRDGQVSEIDFAVTVTDAPAVAGPSVLRRKMPQAEVNLKLELLRRVNAKPRFRLVLTIAAGRDGIAAARQTLRTLTRQTYPEWELCVRLDTRGPARGKQLLQTVVEGFEDFSHQISVLETDASSLEDGSPRPADTVSGIFCWFLAAGDELGCDALLEFAVASAIQPNITLWYSDDRRVDPEGRSEALFKPDWSPDLLLSCNYLGRAWCVDARVLKSVWGTGPASLAVASDYDRVLRLSERCQGIGHVPVVLQQCSERWQDSAATERSALVDAVRRRHLQADVVPGASAHRWRLRRKTSSPRVSVVIPTCAAGGLVQGCLESLREVTAYKNFEVICIENIPHREKKCRDWLATRVDTLISTREPFNWARFNNLAVARSNGECLLFLNDDTQIIDADWMEALVEHAERPEVATVGALLLYPDRSVQHAGFVLDEQGRGRHAFRHLKEDEPGYFGLMHCTRNVIGSTGACLMTRRAVFAELRGFDEDHAVINNDLDYCLRAASGGRLNVYTPYARLIHHELASRANVPESYDAGKFHRRWRGVIAAGDPFLNPNLSRENDQVVADPEPLETLVAGHPRFARSSIKRILVVKLDHIGDCVTALAAVRRLKRYFPSAHLSVLAGRATGPVWGADAAVDEVIVFDFFHARSGKGKLPVSTNEWGAMRERLGAMAFDLAIDLRKQPDTREVLQISGATVLVGFDHQGRFPWLDVALEWDEDVPLRTKHGHVADDLVALVDAVGAHSEESRFPALDVTDASLSLPRRQQRELFGLPVICVHPAAGSVMRQWPLRSFAALIDLLLDLGDCNVALIGGPDEKALTREVLEQVERRREVFDLTGLLPLAELPVLLRRSALFVGNNSGPQHLAAAAGTATIGIHSGVVDAREWGPLGPRAVAVRKDVVCSPCFLEFPEHCQRGLSCLHDLPVGYVYRACLQALARAPTKEPR